MLPFSYPAWITKVTILSISFMLLGNIPVLVEHGIDMAGSGVAYWTLVWVLFAVKQQIWKYLHFITELFLYVIAKDYSVRPKTCVAYSGTFLNTSSTNKVDLWNRSKWDSSKHICLIVTNKNDYVFANSDT